MNFYQKKDTKNSVLLFGV